ncbi:redox-regulated ATPase YchF [Candidatus Pacearchaeota archaeon]|nr:redox-regulated ATPase YchF [Candidatus Pacearchaeota archaeon]
MMLLGLVGKPSVGKSTFFKAATLAEVEIAAYPFTTIKANKGAAYPFTTIKANKGVAYVKVECIDREFKTQCNPSHGFCLNHWRFVPVELMDVAGLVPGASEGKGLGNQFLDDLRQADIFIQIVDASGTTNERGEPEENYDVCKDVKFLEEELNLWYYNILMKVWRGFVKKAEVEKSKFSDAVVKQFSGLKVNEENVKNVLRKLKLPEKAIQWSDEQVMEFAGALRADSKPMIVAANKCDHPNAEKNIKKLRDEFPGIMIYACSADSELALRQAAKAGLIEYIPGENNFKILKELNEEQKNGLENFDLLKYLAIFPASANKLGDSKGNILPDCFLLPSGSTALDFAFYLHTDFGKNFIKAIDARTKRALGKDYELKNRDALEIVTR